jgi:hypothetical protein
MKHQTYIIPPTKPQLVLSEENYSDLEQQLLDLDASYKLREVELTFKKDLYFFGEINSSRDISKFLRDMILPGIEVQEHFIALFVNNAHRLIGYYYHSKGSLNSTQIDVQLLTATALRILAKGVIVAHNHPSGSLRPSEADRKVTTRMREALRSFDITLLDHLIITATDYYSFADEGEASLAGHEMQGILQGNSKHPDPTEQLLREEIMRQFKKTTPANAPNLYAMLTTPGGYLEAEQMVIQRVLHDQLVPEAVIPLIEQEMEMV